MRHFANLSANLVAAFIKMCFTGDSKIHVKWVDKFYGLQHKRKSHNGHLVTVPVRMHCWIFLPLWTNILHSSNWRDERKFYFHKMWSNGILSISCIRKNANLNFSSICSDIKRRRMSCNCGIMAIFKKKNLPLFPFIFGFIFHLIVSHAVCQTAGISSITERPNH